MLSSYGLLDEAYRNSRLNRIGESINQLLPDVANQGGSGDKGSHHHDYLDYYEHLFRPLQDKPFSLLEIGINMGYSLMTWLRRYPNVRVTGIDINLSRWNLSKSQFALTADEQQRLRIIEGDATLPVILHSLPQEEMFDVIIDDGSHVSHDMILSLELLFPSRLKKGGLYIVEDVHCDQKMISFLHYAQDHLLPHVYKSNSWSECKMLSGTDAIQSTFSLDWRNQIREIIFHRDIIVLVKES